MKPAWPLIAMGMKSLQQTTIFALLGRETIDGHDCYVLQLSPKREAVELVRGKAWVDASNFELRRIAGETCQEALPSGSRS